MSRNTMKKRSAKPRTASKKEVQQRIKQLRAEEAELKGRLHRFEAVITAAPSLRQESRLKNWNVLPPPDDLPHGRMALSRAQQMQVSAARSRQAIVSFILLVTLVLFVVWFLYELRAHHIQW